MSTILYDVERFERIGATLLRIMDGPAGQTSCSVISGELHRCLDMDPFRVSPEPRRLRVENFVTILHHANVTAFNERYADGNAEMRTVSIEVRPYDSLPALLKACRGVRYNLDTAAPPAVENSLNRIITVLYDAIVEALPEYEEAEW